MLNMFSIRMVVTQFYTCEKLIKLSTYDLYTYDYCIYVMWASLVAQRLKRLPAMRETWVRSLGQEDPLEKEMATHSSILAWRIPWTVHGVAKSRTRLSDFTFTFYITI